MLLSFEKTPNKAHATLSQDNRRTTGLTACCGLATRMHGKHDSRLPSGAATNNSGHTLLRDREYFVSLTAFTVHS